MSFIKPCFRNMMATLAGRHGQWLCIASVLALSLAGCAQTVLVRQWKTLPHGHAATHRIAILNIEGPVELADVVRRSISQQLGDIRMFEIVTPSNYRSPAEAPTSPGYSQSAHKATADTFVYGSVKVGYSSSGIGAGITFGDPELKVVLELTLVDAPGGNVVARESVAETEKGEFDSGDSTSSESRVAARLTERCAKAAVTRLFATQQAEEVELVGGGFGKGASEIRKGNKLATEGNWAAATAQYAAALNQNPTSHAAAYNMGVAHEATGDFATARRLYDLAYRAEDRDLYGNASRRVARAEQEYMLAATKKPRFDTRPVLGVTSAPVATTGFYAAPDARIAAQRPGHVSAAMRPPNTPPVAPITIGPPAPRRLPPVRGL